MALKFPELTEDQTKRLIAEMVLAGKRYLIRCGYYEGHPAFMAQNTLRGGKWGTPRVYYFNDSDELVKITNGTLCRNHISATRPTNVPIYSIDI